MTERAFEGGGGYAPSSLPPLQELQLPKTRTGYAPVGVIDPSDEEAVLSALSTVAHARSDQSKDGSAPTKFIRLAFIGVCISVAAVATSFGVLGFMMGVKINSCRKTIYARPLKKLDSQTVILISFDAFRWDYPWKAFMPNVDRLRNEGTEADGGIIPVFPTITFPNHYSISTGLYPESHGIIANTFRDPATGEKFDFNSTDPKWWKGEPLWVTASKQGVRAATVFWPGSGIKRDGWDCESQLCKLFELDDTEIAVPGVDAVLSYFDMKGSDRPRLIHLYLPPIDEIGHRYGPDSPQLDELLSRMDGVVGRLLDGLEERGVMDDVNIIFLGDHGMVSVCEEKSVYLEDLSPQLNASAHEWCDSVSPFLLVSPPAGVDVQELYAEMRRSSLTAPNGQLLSLFLKESIPDRLHYKNNPLIPPILGIMGDGYGIRIRRELNRSGGSSSIHHMGQHGYDNALRSMHPVFAARGPRFAAAQKVTSFENVQIYNIICEILGIQPADNNGSASFAKSILLPLKS